MPYEKIKEKCKNNVKVFISPPPRPSIVLQNKRQKKLQIQLRGGPINVNNTWEIEMTNTIH
jgi:hypothetical protein